MLGVIFFIFPFLLLCTSLWLIFKRILKQVNMFHLVFLSLNALFIFTLITITTYSIAADNLTSVPASIYWILILAALVIGIVSFVVKYIPGQIMSAALLLFTAFVTLFTIGLILLILFVIELVIIIINLKQYRLSLAKSNDI